MALAEIQIIFFSQVDVAAIIASASFKSQDYYKLLCQVRPIKRQFNFHFTEADFKSNFFKAHKNVPLKVIPELESSTGVSLNSKEVLTKSTIVIITAIIIMTITITTNIITITFITFINKVDSTLSPLLSSSLSSLPFHHYHTIAIIATECYLYPPQS